MKTTKWTEQDFEKYVDRKPEQDDLDRANCDKGGSIGHYACGICQHDLPVFMCQYCFVNSINFPDLVQRK